MTKIILEEENEYLNQLLKEAYKMLTDIGIQPAPLESIVIRYDKNKHKRYTATCTKNEGKFYIALHYRSKEEKPREDGRPLHTFRSIMHELIHTCTNPDTGDWLRGHNEYFMNYARMIREAYHINIVATIGVTEFKYTHLPCLYSVTCPHCGSSVEYYSEKDWKKYEDYYKEFGVLRSYCEKVEPLTLALA